MIHKCPHCQSALEIQEEWLGMEISCSVCGKNFTASPAVQVTPAVQVNRVQQAVQPKKVGMIVSWVLFGISAFIDFSLSIAWMIWHLNLLEIEKANDWEARRRYWDETQTFLDVVQCTRVVNGVLFGIFIVMATIFTIIYINRSLCKPITAGWQAALKRIKASAVTCGILFAVSKIAIMLTGLTLRVLVMLSRSGEIKYEDYSNINVFFPPCQNLLFIAGSIFGALAVIFTVKYWIWKKSQENQ